MTLAGGLAIVIGFAAAVVLFFQPWRSCADDDVSAGCPVTVLDGNLRLEAMVLFLLGMVLVVIGLLRRK